MRRQGWISFGYSVIKRTIGKICGHCLGLMYCPNGGHEGVCVDVFLVKVGG